MSKEEKIPYRRIGTTYWKDIEKPLISGDSVSVSIFSYLDNDAPGKNTTKILKKYYPKTIDCSFTFTGFSDLNEYLKSIK